MTSRKDSDLPAQPPAIQDVRGSKAPPHESRRSFIKHGGVMLAGGAISVAPDVSGTAHAYGSDQIKIGLIGCGRRGLAVATNLLEANGSTEDLSLVALADVFPNNLQSTYRSLRGRHSNLVANTIERFTGLDAYKGVLNSDADLVILATPPAFRPIHFEAAVAAGKHVFMEKPVAVDCPGVRRVILAGQVAKEQNLAIQVGLQRRHETRYRQCIEQLQSGLIGEPVFTRAYWTGTQSILRPRRASQTELEYQLRNWCHFDWLRGDLITEQHIHNLDVINWLLDAHPVQAQGQGDASGHMIEYVYPGGVRLLSQCRRRPKCWNNVSEHVHATDGYAEISATKIFDRNSNLIWKSDARVTKDKGTQQQIADLISALRRGDRPNETQYACESTLTAIMGRKASSTGKIVRWDQVEQCEESLCDPEAITSLSVLPTERG